MFSKMFPFVKKQGNYLKLIKVENYNGVMTLTFKKPDFLQVNPGQYFAIYPSRHLPKKIIKPLVLAIFSGSDDDYIKFTFSKAAHTLSVKKALEIFKFHEGKSILLDGPFGKGFTIDNSQEPILVIGAGSGISLIHSIKHSADKDKPINIIYSAKDIENIPNFDEINLWVENKKNYLTLTQAESVPTGWHHGRINDYLLESEIDQNTKILICGPDMFIKAIVDILQEKSYPQEKIFISSNQIKAGDNENIYSIETPCAKNFLAKGSGQFRETIRL
ncbi:hypothetical protein ACNVED_08305 [Legionella sp. D16C41]|uniref:hypothetical protein n=1 Tax=Legionella sp. D16C41 TaxID=3402688 RepID=UPI003AF598EE